MSTNPVAVRPVELYARPGGYPLVYHMADGGLLCPGCVADLSNPITFDPVCVEAHPWISERGLPLTQPDDPEEWSVLYVEPNWEGNSLWCDHCGRQTPSAYED